MSPSQLRRFLFGCFVLSGFSGLVYQIVWVRLALASFGVITPFASVVVSVFMLGLALGRACNGGKAVSHERTVMKRLRSEAAAFDARGEANPKGEKR